MKACSIYGDPHIDTFDGQHASYYSAGEYWIVKSSTVHIQGRYLPTPITHGLSVTKEIAIGGPFLKGHKIRVAAHTASMDGTPILTSFPSQYNGPDGIQASLDSQGDILQRGRAGKQLHVVHLTLPNSVSLQINRWDEPGEGNYINARITMPAQQARMATVETLMVTLRMMFVPWSDNVSEQLVSILANFSSTQNTLLFPLQIGQTSTIAPRTR